MTNPNFEVRDEYIEERLKSLGHFIEDLLKDSGYGFSLLIFSFGEGGNMFYMSNAERDGVIKAMKEFIAKEKKQ